MWVIRRIRGLRAPPRGCARNRCRSMQGLRTAPGPVWPRALLAVTSIAGVGAPAAVAGGVPVQIAAGGAAVWACSDSGVVKLDAHSGRVLQRPRAGASYPLQVALGGGAAWIASVESGYASGALTRVDLRTKQVRTQLRLSSGPVFGVAANGRHVWTLIGPTSHAQVARVDPRSGRKIGVVDGVFRPSSLAADNSGLWIATSRWLLHTYRSSAVATKALRLPSRSVAPPALAVGFGSAWVSQRDVLARVSERTNELSTRIRLRGVPVSIAVGDAAVWAILLRPPGSELLIRLNPQTNKVTGQVRIPREATSVAVGAGGVWLGLIGRSPRVLRVEPKTLNLRLFARL